MAYSYPKGQTPYSKALEESATKFITKGIEQQNPPLQKMWNFLSPPSRHSKVLARVHRLVPVFVDFTEKLYPNHTFSTKVYTTVYTTFLTYIDDQVDNPSIIDDLERFAFGISNEFHNPVVGCLQHLVVHETPRHFSIYITGLIFKTTIDYVLSAVLEFRYPNGLPTLPPNTCTGFPLFQRKKTGASECFALFLFPEHLFPAKDYLPKFLPVIPEVIEMFDGINDVLSFYKECVVGNENNNFVLNKSRCMGVTPMDVLKETGQRMVECNRGTREALVKEPALQKVCSDCFDGYITWHCDQKRYRLNELGLEHLGIVNKGVITHQR